MPNRGVGTATPVQHLIRCTIIPHLQQYMLQEEKLVATASD